MTSKAVRWRLICGLVGAGAFTLGVYLALLLTAAEVRERDEYLSEAMATRFYEAYDTDLRNGACLEAFADARAASEVTRLAHAALQNDWKWLLFSPFQAIDPGQLFSRPSYELTAEARQRSQERASILSAHQAAGIKAHVDEALSTPLSCRRE